MIFFILTGKAKLSMASCYNYIIFRDINMEIPGNSWRIMEIPALISIEKSKRPGYNSADWSFSNKDAVLLELLNLLKFDSLYNFYQPRGWSGYEFPSCSCWEDRVLLTKSVLFCK